MSAYRPASRLREGWQVFVLGSIDADEPGEWRKIVKVLRVYSPLSFVRLELEGGMYDVLAPGDEVRSRTLAEVKAAQHAA